MFNNEQFGKYFAKMRRDRGIAQERVAGIIGITKEALSRFENGKTCLRQNNLMKLMDFYNVSVTVMNSYYSRSQRMQLEIDVYENEKAAKL